LYRDTFGETPHPVPYENILPTSLLVSQQLKILAAESLVISSHPGITI
jgi:hypothetical protein